MMNDIQPRSTIGINIAFVMARLHVQLWQSAVNDMAVSQHLVPLVKIPYMTEVVFVGMFPCPLLLRSWSSSPYQNIVTVMSYLPMRAIGILVKLRMGMGSWLAKASWWVAGSWRNSTVSVSMVRLRWCDQSRCQNIKIIKRKSARIKPQNYSKVLGSGYNKRCWWLNVIPRSLTEGHAVAGSLCQE